MDCVIGGCATQGRLCFVCGRECPAAVGLNSRVYCSPECRARGRTQKIRRARKKPEAMPCAVCGVEIQQDLGSCGRTKNLCSQPCKTAWKRAREGRHTKPESVPCVACGCAIPQVANSPGRIATICSDECRRAVERAREKKPKKQPCERCGYEFDSPYTKRFCSRKCQYNGRGESHGETRPCERCSKPVVQTSRRHKFCSRACAKPPSVFRCLNCDVEFKKKIFKSGSYSCATKYCSRECAFEARRLKKNCARRPFDIARTLASWFLSWGECERPKVRQCSSCGMRRLLGESEVCKECTRQSAPRECRSCGIEISKARYQTRCEWCKDKAKRDAKRKAKNKYGRNHKQRTRRRGAAYTPIRNSSIYERDNWECQICCRPLERVWKQLKRGDIPSPRARTVDHVIPLAQGKDSPGHVWHNLIACCHECNTAKCDKDPTGWHCTLPRSPDPFALP